MAARRKGRSCIATDKENRIVTSDDRIVLLAMTLYGCGLMVRHCEEIPMGPAWQSGSPKNPVSISCAETTYGVDSTSPVDSFFH